jgi:predicted nucleotidyltransferase
VIDEADSPKASGEFKVPGVPEAECGESGDSTRLLESARDAVLAAMPEAWAVYLYGSFAQATESPHSDVDIAVLLPPGREIPDLLETISNISQHLGREADLVDLRRAGDVFRREVLDKGRSVYVSRPEEVLAWEASALSRYGIYREDIRGILEDFERTGVGYAP